MELSPKQQIVELIKKSQDILLLGHAGPSGDSIGSLLALWRVLKDIGKNPSVVVSDKIPSALAFLPEISEIKTEPEGAKDIVLKVKIKDAGIEKISTRSDEETLDIIITPQNGKFETDDVIVEAGKPQYDCIIVLDTPDVEKIDKVYDKHTELFFETPVVNIDHHAGNEYFGTVNLVDLTAASTAEILVAIFEALGRPKPDEDTATLLLAGITADTSSFKNNNTTPKTMTVAAQLLAAGARQQDIIQNFYKMKSLKALKLWGKILSNVEKDTDFRIVWSKISYQDFSGADSTLDEAKEVMDKMLINTPNVDVVTLLIEADKNTTNVFLKGVKGTDVLEVAEIFHGRGTARDVSFEIKNMSLAQAEEKILGEIRKIRSKKLGRSIKETEKPDNRKTKEQDAERVGIENESIGGRGKELENISEMQGPMPRTSKDKPMVEEKAAKEYQEDQSDAISKAIESLEAAGEKISGEEENPENTGSSVPAQKKQIQKDPGSLTHVSEVLKKFNLNDKKKLEEFKAKNESTRENLKRGNGES